MYIIIYSFKARSDRGEWHEQWLLYDWEGKDGGPLYKDLNKVRETVIKLMKERDLRFPGEIKVMRLKSVGKNPEDIKFVEEEM